MGSAVREEDPQETRDVWALDVKEDPRWRRDARLAQEVWGHRSPAGSIGWAIESLRDLDMPSEEIAAILGADEPELVHRYFELHLERLEERLEDQRRFLDRLEPLLTGRCGARWRGSRSGRRAGHVRRRVLLAPHDTREGGVVDRIVDLTHPIEHGMTTYPGIPSPEIEDHLTREASRGRYAPGTEFHFGRISLVGNTGTYIDSPFHRYVDGSDLATTPLDRMTALDGVVVKTGDEGAIDAGSIRGISVSRRAVLFRTDWSRHWGSDAYFSGHPHLTADAASWLVAEGVTLVGIDSLNVDGTETGERPVHSTLLAAGVPIVEHLCCLDRLPAEGFQFHAAPPGVIGLGTFPVRAYAVLNQGSPGEGIEQ